jgi:hypothetical protein
MLVLLFLGLPVVPVVFAGDQPAVRAVGKTGKERLSDKASDEQRVNDCKVPLAKRTRDRPTSCRRQ